MCPAKVEARILRHRSRPQKGCPERKGGRIVKTNSALRGAQIFKSPFKERGDTREKAAERVLI